jgi:hypothetical protein
MHYDVDCRFPSFFVSAGQRPGQNPGGDGTSLTIISGSKESLFLDVSLYYGSMVHVLFSDVHELVYMS